MKTPLFTDPQFLDASAPGGLNPAFGAVSGDFSSFSNAAWATPGLLAPEAMTVSFSGMTATVGLPSPWGLVSSGNVVVRAHGAQTGVDTQTYSVGFASLVPATGSVTAFLAATVTTIQQNPFPVPGPPPGHPAYNPNFVPTVAYATTVWTVSLAAVTGGIDNVNTFELFRTTLTAGQSALTSYNTVGQFRAPDRDAWPGVGLTSGGILVPGQAQSMHVFQATGVTATLPPASGSVGLMFGFVNPLAATGTVSTTGTDVIAGYGASGSSSLVVQPSGSVLLWADPIIGSNGQWQIFAVSPNMVPQEWTVGPTTSLNAANLALSGTVLQFANSPVLPGNPTTTTLLVGNSSSGVATTAFVNQGSSIIGNGWRHNPDGSTEQWGTQSFPDIGGTLSVPISFNFPFSSIPVQVLISIGLTSGFNVIGMINESTITASGFTAVLTELTAVVQVGGQIHWRALGPT